MSLIEVVYSSAGILAHDGPGSIVGLPTLLFRTSRRRKLHPMNAPVPDRLDQLTTRVTALEESLTYCQRTLDDLDQVMRDFQKRLAALDGRLTRLTGQLGLMSEAMSEGKNSSDAP